MEWVETTAKSIDEARAKALDLLNVDGEDAEIEVIEDAKTNWLGRIKSEARVRARIKPKAPAPKDDRRNRRGGQRTRDNNRGGRNRGGGGNRGGESRGGNRSGGSRGGENRGGDTRGGNRGDNRGGESRGGDNRGGNSRSGGDNRGGGGRNRSGNKSGQGRGDQGRSDQGRDSQSRGEQSGNDQRRSDQGRSDQGRGDQGRGDQGRGKSGGNRKDQGRGGEGRQDQRNDRNSNDQSGAGEGRKDRNREMGAAVAGAAVAGGAVADRQDGRRNDRNQNNRGRGDDRSRQEQTVDDEFSIEEQKEVMAAFVGGVAETFDSSASVTVVEHEEDVLEAQVTGDDLGLLLGPRGATLSALEELTRTAMQRHAAGRRYARINVDVDGYRSRRREALARFATGLADEVRDSGERKALESMNAADRKVVHDALSEVDGVETRSEGDDPRRYVVIVPTD